MSAYVGDILISSDAPETEERSIVAIREAAAVRGFLINQGKSEEPAAEVRALNIHISNGRMEISADRMQEFRHVMATAFDEQVAGTLIYVAIMNCAQFN